MSTTAMSLPAGKIRARKFAFGPLEKLRLFVSYQRYATLLFTAAAAPLVIVASFFAGAWWAWIVAAAFALWTGGYAVQVFGRWPEKLRLTAVAQRRIEGARFESEMIREHCGDPCFKVVSREILSRAGLPRSEREAIIRRYAAELHQENHETIIIDHVNGVVLRSEGDRLVPVETPQGAQT
jgi:hypothetical protein